jgi:trk system potassium uptake protein
VRILKRPTAPSLDRDPRRIESTTGHVTGLVLVITAMGMTGATIVEALARGTHVGPLAVSTAIVGVPGLVWWRLTRPHEHIPAASIYAAVLASWLAMAIAGTLPYLTTGVFDTFADALFESVSGLTTTGATILSPIEGTAPGVLFWRSFSQWLGGIGVVVFAVSVLSMLGIGGMDLMSAEVPGESSERLAPRVTETAKRLVTLYLGFTTLVATLYALLGMSPFDAVNHAFTTAATGGFSTRDGSIGAFGSPAIEWVAIVAMFCGGVSFILWWRALRGKPLVILRSVEFRAYGAILVGVSAIAVWWNVTEGGLSHDIVRQSIFSVVAIGTTTGYTILDYDLWHPSLVLMLVFLMGVGGMAASTSGGFKVFRLLAVLGYGRRQLFQALHPNAVTVIRFGRNVVPEAVVTKVLGFFALFMAIGAVCTLGVAAFGADMRTAIGIGVAAIGNIGPAIGDAGPLTDYNGIHVGGRTVILITMLVGRLEIFPVILGLVPLLRFINDHLPPRLSQRLTRAGRG